MEVLLFAILLEQKVILKKLFEELGTFYFNKELYENFNNYDSSDNEDPKFLAIMDNYQVSENKIIMKIGDVYKKFEIYI